MIVDTKKVLEKLKGIELIPWEDNDDVLLIPYDPVMLALHSPDCEVKIQPPSSAKKPADKPAQESLAGKRIEAAIRYLEKEFDEMKKTRGYPWDSYWELMRNINLLKYVLNQPQDDKGYPGSTWEDKELGLGKETKKQRPGR